MIGFSICVTESEPDTFAFHVIYLHIRHETLLDPPAVFVDFIQILKLIVIGATHFKIKLMNALLTLFTRFSGTSFFFTWVLYDCREFVHYVQRRLPLHEVIAINVVNGELYINLLGSKHGMNKM